MADPSKPSLEDAEAPPIRIAAITVLVLILAAQGVEALSTTTVLEPE